MAGRNFDNMQSLERQIKDIYFKATFNGSVFSFQNKYGIYALTKTDTGEYKLELEDKWVALRSFDVIISDATARNYTFQVKEYDVNPSSGKAYITFYSNITGTPTDLPSVAILGKVVLKNTSANI